MAEEEASVKVFVRFRPINKRELGEKDASNDSSLELREDKEVKLVIKGKENSFTFDRVFGGTSRQDDVYASVASEAIQDVLNGFHATVFAYGQTGAGKSFSMFGGGDEETLGASFLEIYRETLRDLLNPGNSGKLQIREHKKKIWVEHLSEEYVGAPEDVMELISSGEKLRATSATGMNETSSRSHSVFILKVESRPEGAGGAAARSAVLNLIDLAGSERVGKTGATGQTLKEAQKINQSLSALGNVISALSGGAAEHVPYRDSQLTRLLQESLGGNCKTRLLVACSPHAFNFEETLSSLRFGQRAKTLKNKIHKNEERSPEELKALIRALRAELEEWKAYAAQLRAGHAGAEAPRAAAAPADIVALAKREDAASAELERAAEAAAGLRTQLEERQAELEAALARLAEGEQKMAAAAADREASEREQLLRQQRLESELETAQMRLRIEGEGGGGGGGGKGGANKEEVFLAEMAAMTERLNAARAETVRSEAERRQQEVRAEAAEREAAELREQLAESVPRERAEALGRELAELQVWRSTQEARKARVFRPLKSGGKGPPPAFAEKLDHTELRRGLKSVSADKKLW